MATAKKRSTTAKKAAPKRPAAKKAAAKPRATSVRVSKKKDLQSFKLSPQDRPFLTFSPSVQTLYWTVIGVLAIVFTTWIMTLQAQIYEIYDSIDAANMMDDTVIVEKKKE